MAWAGFNWNRLTRGLSNPLEPTLLRGEVIKLKVERVLRQGCRSCSSFYVVPGCLYVTNYRLVFLPFSSDRNNMSDRDEKKQDIQQGEIGIGKEKDDDSKRVDKGIRNRINPDSVNEISRLVYSLSLSHSLFGFFSFLFLSPPPPTLSLSCARAYTYKTIQPFNYTSILPFINTYIQNHTTIHACT